MKKSLLNYVKSIRVKDNRYIFYVANNTTLVFSLTIAIPLIGLCLSLYDYNSAFERSGSLLVCFAIFNIYINHFVVKHKTSVTNVRDSIFKNRNNPGATIRDLNLNPHVTDKYKTDDLKRLNAIDSDAREDIVKFKKASQNIIHVEFFSGILGTLVWGFGGLLFPC